MKKGKQSNQQQAKKSSQIQMNEQDQIIGILKQIFEFKSQANTIYCAGILEDSRKDMKSWEDIRDLIEMQIQDNVLNIKNQVELNKKYQEIYEKMVLQQLIAGTTKQNTEEKKEVDDEERKDKQENYEFANIPDDLNVEDIHELEKYKEQMELQMKYGCVLCQRIMPLTYHHLIPRFTHKKNYNKDKEQSELNQGIWICRSCHSGIHSIYDEETLAQSYNTLEKLLESEKVVKMAKYFNKQKISSKADTRLLEGNYQLKSNQSKK